MTKAAEIFGGSPIMGENGEWVSIEEAGRRWVEKNIESTPFVWVFGNGRRVALTKGRPSSKCPTCLSKVYKGVLASGQKILVCKRGLFHNCKKEEENGSAIW